MPSQYDTPKRCRIKGTIEYLRAHNIKHDSNKVATFFEGLRARLFTTLSGPDRTFHNIEDTNKTRDRKRKITGAQIAQADRIIEETKLELQGKSLSWDSLGVKINADCCPTTVRRIVYLALNAYKRIAAVKQWLSRNIEIERVQHAELKLREIGHERENWMNVR